MNILHLFPKQTGTRPIHVTIPKRYVYFWEIASYLSKYEKVTSIDALDPHFSIYDLSKKIIFEDFNVLVLLVRSENIYQSIKLAEFVKSIKKEIKIIIYGDIVNHIPEFFKSIKIFDALVSSGDWELSLRSYVDFIRNPKHDPCGVYIYEINKEFPGIYFCDEWLFSDVNKAPVDYYSDLNEKEELTISISRGCPYDCRFCLSTVTFGKKERRKKAKEVIDFMEGNKEQFKSFKLFAPTFNLNKKWVHDFCEGIIKRKLKIAWSATSRIDLLDNEDTVNLMAKAGCYKVSVGIETINESAKYLHKEFHKDQIVRVANYFNKNGIILKGLVMLGIPNQTKKDVFELFDLMRKNKIKIRPTSYSPLEDLKSKANLTVETIQRYDKFTYYGNGIDGIDKEIYYHLLFDPQNFDKYISNR